MMAPAIGNGRRGPSTGRIVAALDIGTYKVCCLIGALEPSYAGGVGAPEKLRLLGFGHQRSQGIAAGAVADMRLAQSAVAAAVTQAEQAAGLRIERVMLGVNCGELRSRTFNGHVDLPEGIVREVDIARLDAGACAFAVRDGSALVALNRIAFSLDVTAAVHEPRGLAGRRLDASHHAVTSARGPLQNLCYLVESCHIEPAMMLPAGFASALSATTEAERRAGVACVDIGAGVVAIAGFADGFLVFAANVPVGGQQVTEELAYTTATALAEAERIKTLYGSLAHRALDEHELIEVACRDDGHGGVSMMSRAEVGRIVAGSTARLLSRVRGCLDACSIPRIRGASVVLTGGGSELVGLEGFAAAALGRSVRVSAPLRLEGAVGRLSGSVPSLAFACVVGLALAAVSPKQWIASGVPTTPSSDGYLGRVQQWLRESF